MKNAEALFPPGTQQFYEKMGYSPAVRCGNQLHISGQVGVNASGIIEDPAEQIRAAFKNIGVLLTQAGADFDDIVDLRSFHVDMEQHEGLFMDILKEFFPKPPFPAMTGMIEVKRLAMKGLIVEIAATAWLPDQNS